MSLILSVFSIFFKLGFFSFGGGYAMIPMIQQELVAHNIIVSNANIANVTAIAGMAPGPVAVNAAVGFGYMSAGIGGVFAAFIGVALPCAVIVLIVASFFMRCYSNKYVQASLYALRAVIVSIIIYAAVSMAIKNGMLFGGVHLIKNGINIMLANTHIIEIKSVLIVIATILLLLKTKIHPIFIILSSAIVGCILF